MGRVVIDYKFGSTLRLLGSDGRFPRRTTTPALGQIVRVGEFRCGVWRV
jgi:hypothetical protein